MSTQPTKSFWQRPEGKTGLLFLVGILGAGAYLLITFLPALIVLASSALGLAGILAALGAIIFLALDSKMRNLVWYMYKSVMRSITGVFVKIDPISILKSYIESLEDSLRKMSKQIGELRGQMRTLKGTIDGNVQEMKKNLILAEQAQSKGDTKNMALSARKAARLKEVNEKYDSLYSKMDILYKVLSKMYENSEIVLEDTADQVKVKEQEYLALKTSHSAIKSAMSIIGGNPDQRALFDQAMEHMAEDVGNKVGEMERFMDTSKGLMDSIDLQNGVFEEEGIRMLAELEKNPLLKTETLDLNAPRKERIKEERNQNDSNEYHDFF